MGGALTFLAAEHAGIDAAAPFYGTPPAELGHVRLFVLCHEQSIFFDEPSLAGNVWVMRLQFAFVATWW